MKTQCVTITWLSKVDLSNINSGEGGGGNVVELKTYRNGKRPYASGQAVRHALREALERGNPGCFLSTPEAPSGNIAEDWLCDLFGYLNPKKNEGADRRWSPIKCTPALGQINSEIITDLLLRMSDLEKDDGKATRDQRLAYVQLTENIFQTGLVLDVHAIGRVLVVEGNKAEKKITRREWVDKITPEERVKRVHAVIAALGQIGDFAKQARNAVSFSPDVFFAAVSPVYTQRGLRTLELDASGDIEIDTLRAVVADLREQGAQLFVGHTPGVVGNSADFLAACADLEIEVGNPISMLKRVAAAAE